MVTVHGGHGWLISQFLNPKLNTRKDRWGGAPIENRARLPVEICKAIRKKVGSSFPIEIRISGSECYDGGYGIEEGIALSKQLDGHADIIHVSAGSHERDEVFTVTHPSMFLDEGCNAIFAEEIKKSVTQSKVVAVGAFSDPALMEEILASGKADFVAMARSLIADPDLPNKFRAGREDDMIKCMRCLSCFSNVQNNAKFYCALNPRSGREHQEKLEKPPTKEKRVLVVGGGVGGMQAALSLADRGHKVLLYERESQLGGALRCEEKVPFKKNLMRYLDKQEKAIRDHPSIELHLGILMTSEKAKALGADVVIASLGSQPIKPALKGIEPEDSRILSAEQVYREPGTAGSKIVILGGGLVGIELGIYLAMRSAIPSARHITILEMQEKLGDGGNHLHAKGLAVEIERYKIDVCLNARAVEVKKEGVVAETPSGTKLFEADTVVYAVGQSPLQEEAMSFHDAAPEFHMLGDCVTPKDITNATSQAFQIAIAI